MDCKKDKKEMEVLTCQTNSQCRCYKCGSSLSYNKGDVKAKFVNHLTKKGRKRRKVMTYIICPVCDNEIWF